MEGKPKRLRPWLESLINSREIPGLQWENEEHTLFRIPWKHRGKHDWSPDNSRIFMEWAKQTGRYREGIDPPDYPAWKTRLRCAFNKAPDIEEVKDMSKLDATYPYRVYRLKPLNKTENLRLVMRSSLVPGSGHRIAKPYSQENRRNFQNNQQLPYPRTPNIKMENVNGDSPIAGYHQPYDEYRPPVHSENGYYHMNASHYNPNPNPHQHYQQQRQFCHPTPEAPQYCDDIRVPAVVTSGCCSSTSSSSSCSRQSQIKQEMDDSPGFNNSTPLQHPMENVGGCEMVVSVMYCGKEVLERVIRTPSGCRISYGSSSPLDTFGQLGKPFAEFVENMYGPSQAESVALPPCIGRMTNEKQEKLGAELLERGLQRGVVLTSKDNDIYAYRLCQSAVFYSSQPGTGGKPLKLRRSDASDSELTKLFDYREKYIPALKDYLDGMGDKPDPRCYLVFGQDVSMFKLDSSVLIVVSVASQAALHDLEKAEAQMSIRTPKVEVSNSTELDHLARSLMTLCQSSQTAAQTNLSLQYSPTEAAPATSTGSTSWFHGGTGPDAPPSEASTSPDDGTQRIDDSTSQDEELSQD